MKGESTCLPIAAIILAAGSASRMGRLKQVLAYGDTTMVQHAVQQARIAGFDPLVVVVGAESRQVRASVAALPVEIAENPNWESGMGSSIVCGMKALAEGSSGVGAVAILLADQPLVTAEHLLQMRRMLSHDCIGVAAKYKGNLGVPAIFARKMFPALKTLPPHSGAKQLLHEAAAEIASFPLPEAAADIDTPEDYARLISAGVAASRT